MLFNSLDFAIFLPIVFLLYWTLKNRLQFQNLFLIVVSYIFYGWWDWRFLGLIILSSVIDYSIGRTLYEQIDQSKRKLLLFLSLITNLGMLGFFKYFNFFIESFQHAFLFFGASFNGTSLNIILPVGISFYTFQTLSYTIDVYRNKIEPTKNVFSFFAFVSFFPQLVAGPIERATNLLPQFYLKRKFNHYNAVDGMRQILWGFFKKIVIADNCAIIVNDVFSNYTEYSGAVLLLGAVLFAFQIYGDFSGYSDIAIGISRLFGFDLKQNFAFPYFSRNIGEFWRRWHISLSTWFRDYLYIPLGGSKGSVGLKIRNTFIIFIVSGFWHGANWTFIVWGALNAIYFLPLLLSNNNRKYLDVAAEGKLLPSIREFVSILFTFFITVIAWVFFRSADVSSAFLFLNNMFSDIFNASFFNEFIVYYNEHLNFIIPTMLLVLLIVEWLQRDKKHALELINQNLSRPFRWCLYLTVYFFIMIFGAFGETEFIYFQF